MSEKGSKTSYIKVQIRIQPILEYSGVLGALLGKRENSGPRQGPGVAGNGKTKGVVILQAVAGGESNPTT